MCDKCTARASGLKIVEANAKLRKVFEHLTKEQARTADFRNLLDTMVRSIDIYNRLMGKTIGFKKECPACNQFEDADTFNNDVCACCDWNN